MKETSNKYALAALRDRRAEIAGEIKETERRLRHLRDMIGHVDITLRLFDPDIDPKKIAPKRPHRRARLFGAGKLNRLILDALRRGDRPMSTAEVTASIVKDVGYGDDAVKEVTDHVRTNLSYLARIVGTVVKTGNRTSARWTLGS